MWVKNDKLNATDLIFGQYTDGNNRSDFRIRYAMIDYDTSF